MSEIKSELSEVSEVSAASQISATSDMLEQQELTDFAQAYSDPRVTCTLDIGEIDHEAIAHDVPYKSGLTPILTSPTATFEEAQRYDEVSDYQAARLKGVLFYY